MDSFIEIEKRIFLKYKSRLITIKKHKKRLQEKLKPKKKPLFNEYGGEDDEQENDNIDVEPKEITPELLY